MEKVEHYQEFINTLGARACACMIGIPKDRLALVKLWEKHSRRFWNSIWQGGVLFLISVYIMGCPEKCDCFLYLITCWINHQATLTLKDIWVFFLLKSKLHPQQYIIDVFVCAALDMLQIIHEEPSHGSLHLPPEIRRQQSESGRSHTHTILGYV